jgi:hypothetical protein
MSRRDDNLAHDLDSRLDELQYGIGGDVAALHPVPDELDEVAQLLVDDAAQAGHVPPDLAALRSRVLREVASVDVGRGRRGRRVRMQRMRPEGLRRLLVPVVAASMFLVAATALAQTDTTLGSAVRTAARTLALPVPGVPAEPPAPDRSDDVPPSVDAPDGRAATGTSEEIDSATRADGDEARRDEAPGPDRLDGDAGGEPLDPGAGELAPGGAVEPPVEPPSQGDPAVGPQPGPGDAVPVPPVPGPSGDAPRPPKPGQPGQPVPGGPGPRPPIGGGPQPQPQPQPGIAQPQPGPGPQQPGAVAPGVAQPA